MSFDEQKDYYKQLDKEENELKNSLIQHVKDLTNLENCIKAHNTMSLVIALMMIGLKYIGKL